MLTVRRHITEDGHGPFQEWLKRLRDRVAGMQALTRANRIEGGHFGDHRFYRDGVLKLRIL
jgi:putative component of toxin-antitoxin plasmid stabilization module